MDTRRSNSHSENNGSDNDDDDSSDSYSVISEILAVSDLDCGYTSDEDENDNDNAHSNTTTESSRYRSVPCLRNNNLFQSSTMHSNNIGRSSHSHFPPPSSSTTTTTTFSSTSSSFQSSRDLQQRSTALNDTWPNSAHLESSSSSIPGTNVEHGRFNRNDHIVSVLRGTFADLLPTVPIGERRESNNIVTDIQHIFDRQERTIELLKKALSEKELQLKKLRASRPVPIQDGKEALPSLLERYPQAMNSYRKKIEHDEYKKEYNKCNQQFESERREIVNTHKQNYRIFLSNYTKRFKKEVDRIANKPGTSQEDDDA